MATKARGAVKGRRVRITRLDSCGRPVYGDDSQAVSKGFISVAWTANTVSTDEVNQPNAGGERCIYEAAETEFVGYSMVATFCEVDPELFALATGQSVYFNEDGEAIGFSINSKVSLKDRGIAVEVWAGTPADGSCTTDEGQTFGYFLAPFLKGGMLGDYTIENGVVTFTITGATTRDGNQWGDGPYNVMSNGGAPGPLIKPLDANDHKLLIWVSVPPPELYTGTRPLLDSAMAAVTAVTAVEGSSPAEADITFTGATAGVPVWVDFGDGEWDYIASGVTGASHTYAGTGPYKIRASSNGTWVETTVTIPF